MDTEFFIKQSKIFDIFSNDLFIHRVSCKTGEGMDIITNKLEGYFRASNKNSFANIVAK